MIIKELSFTAFSKIFEEHDEMFIGIGFTKHGTVSVLLTSAVTWHVARRADGRVTLSSEKSEEYEAHYINLNTDDFDEITIC